MVRRPYRPIPLGVPCRPRRDDSGCGSVGERPPGGRSPPASPCSGWSSRRTLWAPSYGKAPLERSSCLAISSRAPRSTRDTQVGPGWATAVCLSSVCGARCPRTADPGGRGARPPPRSTRIRARGGSSASVAWTTRTFGRRTGTPQRRGGSSAPGGTLPRRSLEPAPRPPRRAPPPSSSPARLFRREALLRAWLGAWRRVPDAPGNLYLPVRDEIFALRAGFGRKKTTPPAGGGTPRGTPAKPTRGPPKPCSPYTPGDCGPGTPFLRTRKSGARGPCTLR